MQKISSLAFILQELFKKKNESRFSSIIFCNIFQLLDKNSNIWPIAFFGINLKIFMHIAIKLRERIENDECMYCKNAKFITTPIGTG